MAEREKLRDCPFDDVHPVEVTGDGSWFVVRCHDCQVDGPSGRTPNEAIEKWNTRAIDAENTRQREALEKITEMPTDSWLNSPQFVAREALKEKS